MSQTIYSKAAANNSEHHQLDDERPSTQFERDGGRIALPLPNATEKKPLSSAAGNATSVGKGNSTEESHKIRVQRLLALSLAVALEKMKDSAGTAAIDEIVSILHRDDFSLPAFKQIVKSSNDCAIITQDLIDQHKNKSLEKEN